MKHELLIVAGEASADINTATVLRTLRHALPHLTAFGVGGPALRQLGLELIAPAEDFSVVGLTEVTQHLPRILKHAARLLRAARARRPRAALLVDLPDFNARLGPLLHHMGIPVYYMGAPQAWAWRPGRARRMVPWVHELACFFPFEEAFFAQYGVSARFVGHPRAAAARTCRAGASRQHIVLMPGSRHSELAHHMPTLVQAIPLLAKHFPDLPIVLPMAPTLSRKCLLSHLGEVSAHVRLHEGEPLHALSQARIALVASGTAVTEALLMRVPMAAFYRLSPMTFAIARRLVRTPHIAMTNILAGERLVPELVQDAFTPQALVRSAHHLLAHEDPLCERLDTLAQSLERPTAEIVAKRLRLLLSRSPAR